jgi:hypothetical protein
MDKPAAIFLVVSCARWSSATRAIRGIGAVTHGLVARSLAAIALFAISTISIAVADPPPPPPLAVWSAIRETVDLELKCAGKVRKDVMPAGTLVKYYSAGACRLTGTVRTPSRSTPTGSTFSRKGW